jgi:hypothetical protein
LKIFKQREAEKPDLVKTIEVFLQKIFFFEEEHIPIFQFPKEII